MVTPDMELADAQQQILDDFNALPRQLRNAARWLIDNPEEVAVLSMREQADRAGVDPSTMTRLVRRLGYEGFQDFKKPYIAAIRGRPGLFETRTEALVARRENSGDLAVAAEVLDSMRAHVETLSTDVLRASLVETARALAEADEVFCLGIWCCHPCAFLAAHLLRHIGVTATLVDGAGATGLETLRNVGRGNAVVAISIRPYGEFIAQAVAFAQERGAAVFAITDSLASPIALDRARTIIVPTDSAAILPTVAPALIVIEALIALVAARRGQRSVDAIANFEAHMERFHVLLR